VRRRSGPVGPPVVAGRSVLGSVQTGWAPVPRCGVRRSTRDRGPCRAARRVASRPNASTPLCSMRSAGVFTWRAATAQVVRAGAPVPGGGPCGQARLWGEAWPKAMGQSTPGRATDAGRSQRWRGVPRRPLTRHWSRRPAASAPLPLLGAAHRQRSASCFCSTQR